MGEKGNKKDENVKDFALRRSLEQLERSSKKVEKLEEKLEKVTKKNKDLKKYKKENKQLRLELDFIACEKGLEKLQLGLAKVKKEIERLSVNAIQKMAPDKQAELISSKREKINSLWSDRTFYTENVYSRMDHYIYVDSKGFDNQRYDKVREGLAQNRKDMGELEDKLNAVEHELNQQKIKEALDVCENELPKLKEELTKASKEIGELSVDEIREMPSDKQATLVASKQEKIKLLFEQNTSLEKTFGSVLDYILDIGEADMTRFHQVSCGIDQINDEFREIENKWIAIEREVGKDSLDVYFEECEDELTKLNEEWEQVKKEIGGKPVAEQKELIASMAEKGEEYRLKYLAPVDRSEGKYFRGEADLKRVQQLEEGFSQYMQEVKDSEPMSPTIESVAEGSEVKPTDSQPKSKEEWYRDATADRASGGNSGGSSEGKLNYERANSGDHTH